MHNEVGYIELADAIVASNNSTAYNSMYEMLGQSEHIWNIFSTSHGSQNLLFVSCQILSKKLLKKEFTLCEDDSESNEAENTDYPARRQLLAKVTDKLFAIVLEGATTLPRHVINSCLNTISVCIKSCIVSSSCFDDIFLNFLGIIQPAFIPNLQFIKPNSVTNELVLINPDSGLCALPEHHTYAVKILNSVLEFVTNSTYFDNYYYFRRNIYFFRNHYLAYFLNYAVFSIKILFRNYNATNPQSQRQQSVMVELRAVIQLLESVVMYPFSLNMHEAEIEDDIHDNISGMTSQIYFPSYFRNFLCDTPLLMDIVSYYNSLLKNSQSLDAVRVDAYALIRILGRCMSASQYVFCNEEERRSFRGTSIQFAIQILVDQRYFDSYLILCLTKVNKKILYSFSKTDFNESKYLYFQTLMSYVKKIIKEAAGKIEDGDKHPIRQGFQLIQSILNNVGLDNALEAEAKACAHDALDLLLIRLTDNEANRQMMEEFGSNNRLEVECFKEIFQKVPEIFKLNIPYFLCKLKQLNIEMLSENSIVFWLHLCSILLPSHDTSREQTDLILKFFHVATHDKFSRTISSLHYIQTLVTEILQQVEDGVSTTYLWKFMEDALQMSFQNFLTKIIEYTVSILMIPSYTLIENALELFKATFTKLCKHRHRSFKRYFDIVEEVSKQIDSTMLVHQDYMKLRINYFSVISMIWIAEGQVGFVYRIISNIRESLGRNNDYIHFLRYLTDLTGILEPVESAEVFKTLVQLILMDMNTLLPYYLGTPEALHRAFSEQSFLRAFVKFLLVLVNDHCYRISIDNQTNLPFKIEETFKNYLVKVLKYDYPKKTVELWMRFIKLNPLSDLLPFDKSLQEKNSPLYRGLLRQYFENLHRLRTLDDFYYMYTYVEDNVEFMTDWWEQIMNRGLYPSINLSAVVSARIWTTNRQKESMGKLLYRVSLYDSRYWTLEIDAPNENKYAEWFVANFN